MTIPAKFDIRDRGPTPRGLGKILRPAMKESWFDSAVFFHSTMSDDRFSHAHATKANYAPRSRNYERKKLKKYGHTRPLEYSGESRRQVRTASISSTSHGASARYGGARKFNFRNPKMRANMAVEFTTVIPEEAQKIARFYDQQLDRKINAYNGAN